MLELLYASISPHQLPLTVLLALVVLYWLLIVAGLIDLETDMGGDADFNLDTDSHHGHGASTGGIFVTAGRFFGFADVPIVVWGSFLALFMWFSSLVLNHLYNPTGIPATALLLLLPNLAVSALATKLTTIPIAKLFKAMADADTEAETVVGRTGIVVSVDVDERGGQLQIAGLGAPVLVNARTRPGESTFKKGDEAKVTQASADNSFFYIEPITPNPES